MPEAVAGLDALLVVVPVHDEEELLPGCLEALAAASDLLTADRPALSLLTLVVLDRCTDASAEVARSHGVRTVALDAGRVGAARAAGVRHGASLLGAPPAATWVATTDGDTVVPADWLVAQVRLAEHGARLVLGRVVPDPRDVEEHLARAWRAHHTSPEPGDHVHGANLGVRLDAYLAAGGFPDVAEHEDSALVDALRAGGVVPVGGARVTTSGRRRGRTPGGFAGFLRDLESRLHGSAPHASGATGNRVVTAPPDDPGGTMTSPVPRTPAPARTEGGAR